MTTPVAGTVYLLHFDRPYRHARGWTRELPARLAEHADAGIGWQLARTWTGTRGRERERERQIKRQGGLSRCCPACGITPRTTTRKASTS